MDGCIFILSAIDRDTTRHVSFKFEWRLERLNLTVEILLPNMQQKHAGLVMSDKSGDVQLEGIYMASIIVAVPHHFTGEPT